MTPIKQPTVIPVAPVERLMKRSGAKRISSKASKALSLVLTELAFRVGERAAILARHAGRKTIKPEDVELAIKHIT